MKGIWSVVLAAAIITGVASCASTKSSEATSKNRIVVLDPGHFHAGLLQMHRIEGMCDTVAVYAPREGQELGGYLYNINYYNNRKRNPTSWVLEKYVGEDYLERMIAERKGNTVVLAGNNQKKTRYIYEAIKAGFNVLADKPMAITTEDFELLEKAYKLAKKAVKKIDGVKEFVFSTEETLLKAKNNGVKISFVSNYNSGLTPVYEKANLNGDNVLEAELTSNFATIAPLGETLSKGYIENADKKYISPDNVIDASTAVFKDNTWFVKDAPHVAADYKTGFSEFTFTLLESETQPTVDTFEKYPQFMIADEFLFVSPLK